jgi:diguanylate cyclase (GGDEF)-like protein
MTVYRKATTDVVSIMPLPDFGRGRPCLIVMRGPTTGELHWVTDGAVLGREAGVPILIPAEEVSRRQCRFEVRADDEVWIEDVGSTNGTIVDGQRISGLTRLKEGARIQLGVDAFVKFTYHDELEGDFQNRMYDAALRDPLTGLYNRRYLDECLEAEFAFATRHKAALTVCMMDIDHFKRVNDTHGHEAGDLVLAEVGERMAATVRAEDTCCRFGGEEFVVVSLGISLAGGLVLAERLRGAIEEREFQYDSTTLPVTVSLGVAGFPYPSIESPESLLSAADQALYLAKQRGRNRCKVFVTP